jgi:hypothetical protein
VKWDITTAPDNAENISIAILGSPQQLARKRAVAVRISN